MRSFVPHAAARSTISSFPSPLHRFTNGIAQPTPAMARRGCQPRRGTKRSLPRDHGAPVFTDVASISSRIEWPHHPQIPRKTAPATRPNDPRRPQPIFATYFLEAGLPTNLPSIATTGHGHRHPHKIENLVHSSARTACSVKIRSLSGSSEASLLTGSLPSLLAFEVPPSIRASSASLRHFRKTATIDV